LIQELKRALVWRRYIRCSTNRTIIYNRTRIVAVILITVRKVISYRKYQGQSNVVLEGLETTLTNML
jgi:hypothetical protein